MSHLRNYSCDILFCAWQIRTNAVFIKILFKADGLFLKEAELNASLPALVLSNDANDVDTSNIHTNIADSRLLEI